MQHQFPTRQNVLTDLGSKSGSRETFDAGFGDQLISKGLTPTLLSAVIGVNRRPFPRMSIEDIRSLGDIFTRDILLQGKYPLTLGELVAAIEQISAGDAFPLRQMFLVAEGGRAKVQEPAFQLNTRLVFTWQRDTASMAELMISTAPVVDDPQSLLQLIAWSSEDGSFHFFERRQNVWGWAGNSFHALQPPSRGKGPFDSHINGGLVMKELKFPWAHWHSQSNSIPREVFGANSVFNTHPLFSHVDGAEHLEAIVQTGIRRWTQTRLSTDFDKPEAENILTYTRQLLTSTSVNLISSNLEFNRASGEVLRLPTSFFFDIDGLGTAVSRLVPPTTEIIPSGRITVDGGQYVEVVEELQMHVKSDGNNSFVQGDVHFCFLVPERAFEDIEVAKQMLERNIISPKFLLSLLMVDFPNPVNSSRRTKLLQYSPVTLAQNERLDDIFVNAIKAAAHEADSPEAEFLSYWEEPNLPERVRDELRMFFEGIQTTVGDKEGLTRLVKLAELRKTQYRKRPLDEFRSTTSHLGSQQLGNINVDKQGVITVVS